MTDLKRLMFFVQTVNCGSFSTAAERLRVTQPAISKGISHLEEELGVRLFNRTTRQLHLTSEGRDFFEKVRVSVEEIDGAITDIRNATKEPSGQVRVAAEAVFGRYCLMPVIADFFLRYPLVKLEIDFADIIKKELDPGIDVAIRHGRGTQASYVVRRLSFDYQIIAVASPLYLSRRGVPRAIEDLAHHECIGASMLNRNSTNWKLVRIEEPSTKARTPRKEERFVSIPEGRLTLGTHYDTSLIAALDSIGIAFIPLPAALPYLKTGHLKALLPDYRVQNIVATDNQLFIQFPHRQHLSRKVRVFIEYLLEKFSPATDAAQDIRAFSA